MLSIDEQCEAEYEQLQRYHLTQQYQVDASERAETRKKRLSLYDRMDSQWLVYAEIGFTITAILGSATVLCFLRVFGAGALAVSMALIVLIAGILLMIFFWGELDPSPYKLRSFLSLVGLVAAMTVALSDTAVDFTRHYWAVLQSATILTGVASLIVFSLILVGKHSLQQGGTDASN
jgi:hypothetical protein